jgi:hypothetical protein
MKLNWYTIDFTLPFVDSEEFPMTESAFSTIYVKVKEPKGFALFKSENTSDKNIRYVSVPDNLTEQQIKDIFFYLDRMNKKCCPQPPLDSLVWLWGDKNASDFFNS